MLPWKHERPNKRHSDERTAKPKKLALIGSVPNKLLAWRYKFLRTFCYTRYLSVNPIWRNPFQASVETELLPGGEVIEGNVMLGTHSNHGSQLRQVITVRHILQWAKWLLT